MDVDLDSEILRCRSSDASLSLPALTSDWSPPAMIRFSPGSVFLLDRILPCRKRYFMQRILTLALVIAACTPALHAQFQSPQSVSDSAEAVWDIAAADFDGDGHLDVVESSGTWSVSTDRKVVWHENDGEGGFAVTHVIDPTVYYIPAIIQAVDMDADGDPDVLCVTESFLSWYENLGGGAFSDQHVISAPVGFAQSAYAADLDGDGDLDVVSDTAYTLGWFENTGGGAFGPEQVLASTSSEPVGIVVSDLNGDDRPDLVFAQGYPDNRATWWENLGSGNFGHEQTITTQLADVRGLFAIDLDSDGDIDLLFASAADDTVAWYENLGGGSFGPKIVVSNAVQFATDVYAADFDGDGDPDVVATSSASDTVAWFENLGSGSFGPKLDITNSLDSANSVHAADLDGDGDLDVIAGGWNHVAWYENLFALVSTFGCGVNPDGSLEVLSGSPTPGSNLVLGIDNPAGTQLSGSLPLLGISLSPAIAYPCGVEVPGYGMTAPFIGELLIGTPPLLLSGPRWGGAGNASPVAITIPADSALIGFEIFTQGLLVDGTPGGPVGVGLTNALRLKIGY